MKPGNARTHGRSLARWAQIKEYARSGLSIDDAAERCGFTVTYIRQQMGKRAGHRDWSKLADG